MTERKVLLTGGAGFIGGHVAEAYVARGDRVWILDDLSTGKRRNVPDGAELVEMSVADERLDDLFRDAGGFDVVNHHAAQIDVRISVADPRGDARTNVDGLLNLLECARRHAVRRVVFVSSGGVVYGEPEDRPTPETAPKMPLSPYGVSKLAGEYYLHYYQRVHGMDYVALRYANVYGPRQDPHGEAGVVAIFSSRIAAGQPLTIYGDGLQTRDYIFVGDVVAANMLITDVTLPAARRLDDRAFNIGTGREASVVELASELMKAAGTTVEIRHAEERAGELRHSGLAISRAASVGWRPVTALSDGLARTYHHIAGEKIPT